jgi:hypothetical protein
MLTVDEGSKVKDRAKLSGIDASEAGGHVEYFVYSESKCKTLVKEAGEVVVNLGSVPPSNEESLPAGIYYWQAVYTGDSKNLESRSTCGNEILTVVGG